MSAMVTARRGILRTLVGLSVGAAAGLAAAAQPPPGEASSLDAFMARVLERRNENWRTLHHYILSERERADLTGPGESKLFGMQREFTWFIRDGYLIRSPLEINGVEPGERERRDYERRWLENEQERERQAAERTRRKHDAPAQASGTPAAMEASTGDAAALVREGLEPRFISEAYFMRFAFDPGNYYFAGRTTLDGREVVMIEYYPTRLFKGDGDQEHGPEPDEGRSARDKDFERDVSRKFNKVALVTLWIDPAQHQIVKYTFENTDLNFLPGRWLARVGDITVSMTMGQMLKDVWLPKRIAATASLTLANGTYDMHYARDFYDYRQGEVKARIRSYTPQGN